MKEVPLVKESYGTSGNAFKIIPPEIKSGTNYYFENDQKLRYQVSFGKKKDNYLANIINFSVISEEYEDEYSETNKGEVWRVIPTIIEVIRMYHQNHPGSVSYEFSGEFKDDEHNQGPSIRTRLFLRTLRKVVDFRYWEVKLNENKVMVVRNTYE